MTCRRDKHVYDKTTSIEQFLAAAGAKQPIPGGGSVAALAGGLAASMGQMVVNYSIGKKGLEEHAVALKLAVSEFELAAQLMLELMAEDQAAYESLTSARKLPADSPRRAETVAAALGQCIMVPLTTAATAVSILDLCDPLVEKVNRWLLSDLAVSADLAMATTRAALYNVRVNLPEIADEKERQRTETTANQLLSRALELIQRVSPRIWNRWNQASKP
jgi:methenyltetrahydrofolate cyclohydrolase